jgi:hypothetical protein
MKLKFVYMIPLGNKYIDERTILFRIFTTVNYNNMRDLHIVVYLCVRF